MGGLVDHGQRECGHGPASGLVSKPMTEWTSE